MDEWQEQYNELESQGWTERNPSDIGASIDRGICVESSCDSCGHDGMVYVPMTNGSGYRAFAVCPECGHFEEF